MNNQILCCWLLRWNQIFTKETSCLGGCRGWSLLTHGLLRNESRSSFIPHLIYKIIAQLNQFYLNGSISLCHLRDKSKNFHTFIWDIIAQRWSQDFSKGYTQTNRGYSSDCHVDLHAVFYIMCQKQAYNGGISGAPGLLLLPLNPCFYRVIFAAR